MKAKVYLETTIISYLAARPTRNVLVSSHQKITRSWWNDHRERFELFVSEIVAQEVRSGDKEASKRRELLLKGISFLEVKEEALAFAENLVKSGPIPDKAATDALHIAIATVHGMDFLLTWNCAHIANAEIRKQIERIASEAGFQCPTICTPEELMGGN